MKKLLALILVCMFAFSGMAMAAEKLTLATNVAFPPYEFYDDETGDPTGIDIKIAEAICKNLGYELVVEDIDFDAIIPGVASGKYDFSMAGMTVTEERMQSVNFSDSYATGIQVIIVLEESELTLEKLFEGGYTIGVQMGTTGDLYTTWDLEDYGLATIERFKTGADAVLALTSGKVDCVVIDNEPAKNFVNANAGKLKILETEYIQEQYAACFSKDNTELLEAFNAELQKLIEDGTVQSIIDTFIPPVEEAAEATDAE